MTSLKIDNELATFSQVKQKVDTKKICFFTVAQPSAINYTNTQMISMEEKKKSHQVSN